MTYALATRQSLRMRATRTDAFSAGNDPTSPALHWADTNVGNDTKNIGEQITGKRVRPSSSGILAIVDLVLIS